MTPTEQQLVRSSWAAIEPIADEAATLFYDRLFGLDPRLKALFRDADMERQRMVLMQSLAVVVRNRVAEAFSAPPMRRKWPVAAPLPLGLAMGSVST
jgi:hemoglobin-like flavoprotein